jgi:U2 small nuclear ribonucleoprotein A'
LRNLQNYRQWVIWLLPTVRFLDYQKVKEAERSQAENLFGTHTQPSALASKIMGIKSRAFDVPSAVSASEPGTLARQAGEGIRVKLTEKERKKVEKMIREAKSLQEIAKLEKELNEGRIPGGAVGNYDDEDTEMNL